jgi:kynurenine formamidase
MPIRRVVDLSKPLDERTPLYPGDPEPRVCAGTSIAVDGFNVLRLDLGSYSGTHCDGWDAHRETDAYFDHSFLDGDASARLLEAGGCTIGIDAINLDETPAGALDRARFRCHAQISAAGGVIVENLVSLGEVAHADPFVSVLPLSVPGGDGAPAPAVAIEGLR